jgi:hypothetical protein
MRNHAEKRKDMIESVLPSTARKMARAERARLHRRRRRSISIELTSGSDDPVGRDVRSEFAELIYSRRAADKVGSLERWAIALIDRDCALREAGVDQQLDHFRRLLPNTKIGRHALSHIGFALRWRAREPWRGWVRPPVVTEDEVHRLYERGLHDELNRQLKQRLDAPRLLRGLDDIEAFAAAAADPEVERIVKRLLR